MVFLTSTIRATKRIPMIKFRKGGQSAKQAGASGSSASSSKDKPSIGPSSGSVIEDYDLPPRYWRTPISQAEMDYINRGGPDCLSKGNS